MAPQLMWQQIGALFFFFLILSFFSLQFQKWAIIEFQRNNSNDNNNNNNGNNEIRLNENKMKNKIKIKKHRNPLDSSIWRRLSRIVSHLCERVCVCVRACMYSVFWCFFFELCPNEMLPKDLLFETQREKKRSKFFDARLRLEFYLFIFNRIYL